MLVITCKKVDQMAHTHTTKPLKLTRAILDPSGVTCGEEVPDVLKSLGPKTLGSRVLDSIIGTQVMTNLLDPKSWGRSSQDIPSRWRA